MVTSSEAKRQKKLVTNDGKRKRFDLSDDTVAIIFTYLKFREKGKALMVCNQWKRIFESKAIQTDDLVFDLRWAKYATSEHFNLPNQKTKNGVYLFHVLEDGRLVTMRRKDNEHLLELYSLHHDLIQTIKVPGRIYRIVSNKNTLITGGSSLSAPLQSWNVNDQSYLQKDGSSGEIHDISNFAISSTSKVYYSTFGRASIHKWDLEKRKDPSSVDNEVVIENPGRILFSSVPHLICWEDMVIVGVDSSIELWSTTNRQHLRTINASAMELYSRRYGRTNGICHLSIEKVQGKNRLVSAHDSGVLEIFSIEDGSLLYSRLATEGSITSIAVSPNNRLFTTERIICSERTWQHCIKIWKLKEVEEDVDQTNNRMLLERIKYGGERFGGSWDIVKMHFLPNGRLVILTTTATPNDENRCDIF